jgi:hypothetical protein
MCTGILLLSILAMADARADGVEAGSPPKTNEEDHAMSDPSATKRAAAEIDEVGDGEDGPSFAEVACEVFLHPALQPKAKGALQALEAKAKSLHSQSTAAAKSLHSQSTAAITKLQSTSVSDLPDITGQLVGSITSATSSATGIVTSASTNVSCILKSANVFHKANLLKTSVTGMFALGRFASEERRDDPAKERNAGVVDCVFESLEQASGDRDAAHTFDTSGALHYIGTRGGTSNYANPHLCFEDTAVAAMSSVLNNRDTNGSADRFLMHGHDGSTPNVSKDEPGQWMSVDLGKGRSLVPNHYCLRHGRRNGAARLRSWRLEGSNDGELWETLKKHANDETLPELAYSVGDWAVARVTKAYRHFRILMTGADSSGTNRLACAGIELYGELRGMGGDAFKATDNVGKCVKKKATWHATNL